MSAAGGTSAGVVPAHPAFKVRHGSGRFAAPVVQVFLNRKFARCRKRAAVDSVLRKEYPGKLDAADFLWLTDSSAKGIHYLRFPNDAGQKSAQALTAPEDSSDATVMNDTLQLAATLRDTIDVLDTLTLTPHLDDPPFDKLPVLLKTAKGLILMTLKPGRRGLILVPPRIGRTESYVMASRDGEAEHIMAAFVLRPLPRATKEELAALIRKQDTHSRILSAAMLADVLKKQGRHVLPGDVNRFCQTAQ